MDTYERVIQSRAGGRVERGHGIPHEGSYNNAAHQWGVAMLCLILFPEHFARIVAVCLTHDVAEAWVGDIPAPTMRYVPGLRDQVGGLENSILNSLGFPSEDGTDLTPEEFAAFKACDRLELWLWCQEQENMGNKFVSETRYELERYFTEQPLPPKAAEFLEVAKQRDGLPRQAGIMKELVDNVAR